MVQTGEEYDAEQIALSRRKMEQAGRNKTIAAWTFAFCALASLGDFLNDGAIATNFGAIGMEIIPLALVGSALGWFAFRGNERHWAARYESFRVRTERTPTRSSEAG